MPNIYQPRPGRCSKTACESNTTYNSCRKSAPLCWMPPSVIVVELNSRLTGSTHDRSLSVNNLGQVVHTRAYATNQYGLVSVDWQQCPTAGKVTACAAVGRAFIAEQQLALQIHCATPFPSKICELP